MNIVEFQAILDDLSSWRKDELATARYLAEMSSDAQSKKYLCRAWTVMMYAHCDNFLSKTVQHYIEFIKQDLPKNYRPDLVWLIFEGKDNAKYASKSYLSPFKKGDNLDVYFKAISSDAALGRNFNYNSLRFLCEWVIQIPFEYKNWEAFCKILTRRRNDIAHGEETYIDDISLCVDWHEKTLKFIDDLKDTIISNIK